MITNDIYLTKLVADYIEHGFAPIPIKYKSKQPLNKGWPDLRISNNDIGTYFNGDSINIGVLTGQPSQGLVDVDIDDTTALSFAAWFLPHTNCVFGRASKPKSHWVYRVQKPKAHEQFKAKGMILEIRGNNRCTVFPGSVHESGEPVVFENPDNYDPLPSTWKNLKRAGSKIAIATELFKAWVPGTRHELTLCLAAKLARLAWDIAEARDLITAIATEANDEEIADRLVAVKSTFEAYAQGQQISGEERFTHLVGAEIAANIHRWACSPDSLRIASHSGSKNEGQPDSKAFADLSSDSGTADAFAAKFEKDLIYCGDDRGWFLRKNRVFEPAESAIVQGLAKDFLQEEVGKVTAGPVAYVPLKSCLTRTRINAAIDLSRAQLYVEPASLDENLDLAGCCDGNVLDLNTGSTIRDDLDAVVTKKLDVNFTKSSTCPEWTKFLNQIFAEDDELIKFLQRAVGYCLTGHISEQCLFILIGTGANGKSTFLNVLQSLMGDYAGTIPMQSLMEQRYGSQTNDLAYLVGKRLVVASEGERGHRIAESKIKMMTGSDRISCRALYKDYFVFEPHFKLWLATNNLPTISGMDDAIWRRIRVIEFPVQIPLKEQDKTLADRLIKELPGILQWALEGLSDWRKIGLDPPESVLQSTRTYREDNDSVGQWIETACVREPKLRASMKDLYESYKSWCENSSLEPMHNTFFGKELTRLGFKSYKFNKGNGRIGIGLKQPPGMAGDVASNLAVSLTARAMRSKPSEAVLN